MRALPLEAIAACVRGAADVRIGASGVSPRRLPAWALARIDDPTLETMARMTSGVRLALETEAEAVEVEVLETALRLAPAARSPAAFDIVLDGGAPVRRLAEGGATLVVDFQVQPPTARLEPGEPCVLAFHGLPPGRKRLEIWLPQSAAVQIRAVRVSPGAEVAPAPARARVWAHYGSSISHGMEADGPTGTWPAVAARLAGVDLSNLGLAGQCQLDGAVARVLRDGDADVISLKLGINVVNLDSMRARVFGSAVGSFLDTVRETRPERPLLVISPILCPIAEDRPGPTVRDGDRFRVLDRPTELGAGALTLRAIRARLAAIVARRRAEGDAALFYLDGLQLFGAEDAGDLDDGLHPNARGLARIGRRFADMVFAAEGCFGAR